MIENVNIDVNTVLSAGMNLLSTYGPKLLSALVVLWVGFRITSRVIRLSDALMKRNKVDVSLRSFLESLLDIGLKIVIIISAASMIGVQTTSFVAILGAAGLAIGLALQGSLANFAGGALILLFKPYKVGDFIEAQGEKGTVEKIQILNTVLTSPEQKTIILPNGAIANGNVINYSKSGKIRVDLNVGISYSTNIQTAKEVLLKAIEKNPLVLSDPKPVVGVSELADSSVNLIVRQWCAPKDYWSVYFANMEAIKMALDEAKIEIPFPQRVVYNENTDID